MLFYDDIVTCFSLDFNSDPFLSSMRVHGSKNVYESESKLFIPYDMPF